MDKVNSVLIIGANFTNKGAEAMLKTVQAQLRKKNREVICYMICRKYERELAESFGFIPIYRNDTPLKIWIDSYVYRIKGKLYKLFTGVVRPWYFPFPFGEINKIVKKLDAIIDVSGFAYADSWGKPMVDETIKLIKLSRPYHVKFFFMPQAWGPFENPEVAKSAQHMLSLADGFFARDMVSQTHLAGVVGKDIKDIPLLPDLVFSAGEQGDIPSTNRLKDERLGGSTIRVGISPNLRVYEKMGNKGADNVYIKVLLSLCNYCLQTFKAEIVFIPNELFPDSVVHPDDRGLCRQLYEALGKPASCKVIDRYASSEDIREQVRQVDLLVSSRFHALIFGFLARKPVMAISWSHKYRELFGLFGLEDFVLESNLIDEQSVIAKFQQLVGESEEISSKIDEKLPFLKQQIDTMFDNLFSC